MLGNHDQARVATRLGPAQARVAMVLLLTLRGTPTLYYGDELGLANVPIPPERERDPFGIRQPGTGQGRDPIRTPMPWDGSANCGFTTGEPWLPLGADHAEQSVEAQRRDPASMLILTRTLLELRGSSPPCRSATGRRWWPKITFSPTPAPGVSGASCRAQSGRCARTRQPERPRGADRALDASGPHRPAHRDRLELAGDEAVLIET